MKFSAICILGLLLFSQSFSATREELRHNACAATKKCLDYILPGCSEDDLKPVEDIEYNGEFCSEFVNLKKRGIDLKSPITAEMFGHLGSRYRVIYSKSGVLPVTKNMMSYLFDHFPFTTVLVNVFQETNYTIHYNSPDQRLFSGDNGGHLYGDFYWALQDSAGVDKGFHDVFYGSGRCKILTWSLHGIAIATLDMYPEGDQKTRYVFRAIVFPANGFLNTVMQWGVFRSVVDSKISEIINNISESSESYVAGNHMPVDTSSVLKKQYASELAEFKRVAAGEIPWTVGDAVEKKREEAMKRKPVFETETPMIFKQQKFAK